MFTSNYLTLIVWFEKISRPPPRRELEIPGGWGGGSEAQEIPEGRGVGHYNHFPGVNIISFLT